MRWMRVGLLGIALAGWTAPAARPVPPAGFFDIDQPVWLGAEELAARLQPARAARPIVALHLSGGSARAFCHLGVLKRMEEQGLRPDLIVTNSMGSIIGLLYAAGIPVEVIEDIFRSLDYERLFTPRLPSGGGMVDLRGLLALAGGLVGEVDISELPIPIVVVCADLRSMKRVILCRGDFLTVLQAAIAIPALFEPVELDGFLLVDGGINNLVPLEPFMALADATVSSTAFYNRRREPSDPFTALLMGLDIAKNWGAVRDIKAYQPFLIRNDVEELTFMGYQHLDAIIRRGYESCARRIEELELYLGRRGVPAPLPEPPARRRLGAEYESRWKRIKRGLRAGLAPPLPRGFGAFQVHPLVLRRYRGANRMEQANYLAASYLYEAGSSRLRAGALTDLAGGWGGLLYLETALGGRLQVGLRNYAFFRVDGAEMDNPRSYHHLFGSLPQALGERLVAGPFLSAELRVDLDDGGEELDFSAGLDVRLSALSSGDFLHERLAWFARLDGIEGVWNELSARKRLFGPLSLFSRVLVKAALPSPAGPGLRLTYNDFFRGAGREAAMGSFAVLNSELVLSPRSFSPTFWEAVILKEIELAAFCDLFWAEAASLSRKLDPSVGLSLKADAAFLGLLPLTAVLSGGYDLDAERAFFTLNLGAVY